MPDTQASVVVISPDRAAQQAIAAALGNRVKTLVSFATYPHPNKLIELPQPAGGCLMFLDFTDPFLAKVIAEEVDASFPDISVVALHNEASPQDLLDLMRLGVREVINVPPMEHEVLAALSNFAGKREESCEAAGGRPGRIAAFLPAKPGAGASTLALHAAAAAARISEKALLVDFDFRQGITSFLLKLPGPHSVLDALKLNRDLDKDQWNGLVNRVGLLDVLGSAPLGLRRSDPEEGTGLLLEFARSLYPCVCVDLPGEMRDYELDVLRRAQECLLVCTPDVVSLHMAKAKANMLRQLKVDGKTSVILNRSGGAFMPVKEIEQLLQLPVRFSVPNAEKEMNAAIEAASPLTGRSAVAAQIETIAQYLIRDDSAAPQPLKARRFLDFFSASPARAR